MAVHLRSEGCDGVGYEEEVMKLKLPTLADRLWFVWDHRRSLPLGVALAIVLRKATGYIMPTDDGYGAVYCNHGYALRRD